MGTTAKTDPTISNLQNVSHPTLILIRGLPGSGKSYLASALQKALGKERVLTLDPDTIDYLSKEYTDLSKDLTSEGVEKKFHPHRFLRTKAHTAITSNKIIIWNQAFTNLGGFNRTVAYLQTYALEHDTHLPLLVVEVEISHDTAKARIAKREKQGGHSVPEGAFVRFINDYASFADKGFNTIVVHGEDDISASVASVIKALKELWKR
ncbi:MAG TPA: AAA family ATPase [Candidatus Saccharimonadales bacterium]|nr:AAA family ATPase [Candidatus Saccharimonadales bacterium]